MTPTDPSAGPEDPARRSGSRTVIRTDLIALAAVEPGLLTATLVASVPRSVPLALLAPSTLRRPVGAGPSDL